jgi:hypothetical protein
MTKRILKESPPATRWGKMTAYKEFDPALFATKLEYVEDLGISEENGVGENRGRLYVALRDEFGFTAGFVAVENPKFPKQLLKNEQVVKLKRA